ncbi:MAG: lipid-A-disaccharide synthase [Bacteroidales bacterium]|nr:lipid-A-disaccharide synthase [Bacteroidales bacterium]
MNYYIIAGEASGDLHGSNLIKALQVADENASFRIWGGDLMAKAAGVELVKHYRTYDYMGIVEVVKHARLILNNLKFCKQDIASHKPDAIIFIDFPGFNLKIAPFAKKIGIPTFFYISPTVWAWKENRVKKIKACVDHMFVELPFVKTFYETRHNYHVDFVGHPLLDSIAQFKEKHTAESFKQANNLPDKKLIAVLPGSREYEIRENLKTMQSISEKYTDYQFVVAGMSRFSLDFYNKYITANNLSVVFDQTYELLKKSDAAIVVSGSATLETAILNIPEIIVYQTSPITWNLGKLFVKLNNLGLPNLIMEHQITPELLQEDMTSEKLEKALDSILYDETFRNEILHNYELLRNKLGNEGASRRVAEHIQTYMKEKK